jgi:putative acetyltransferase
MDYRIRRETKEDERIVEEITRKAFWDIHCPGCNEHYLVHLLRKSEDFMPELDFIIETDGKLIGNIMYSRSYVQNKDQEIVETITFGPVSILPEYQKRGFGSMLIKHSIEKAKEMGHAAIIIYGNPHDYCKHGFCGSKKYGIGIQDHKFPCALLTRPLQENVFKNDFWRFYESESFNINDEDFKKFDASFERLEKKHRYSQEEFDILSHSFVE